MDDGGRANRQLAEGAGNLLIRGKATRPGGWQFCRKVLGGGYVTVNRQWWFRFSVAEDSAFGGERMAYPAERTLTRSLSQFFQCVDQPMHSLAGFGAFLAVHGVPRWVSGSNGGPIRR